MFSRKNALILKGNLPANDVLDILDTLIQEVARHTKSRPPPQPWELFSFICASGNLSPLAILLGRLKKSSTECRKILKSIQPNPDRLSRLPSPWNARSAVSKVKQSLADICGDSPLAQDAAEPGHRCCVMIWKPRAAVEVPNNLTSHSCSSKECMPVTESVSAIDALTTSLSIVQGEGCTESPFHGLVNEVVTWQDFHDAHICISIRSPPSDLNEAVSEQWAEDRLSGKGDPSSNMRYVRHFGFVLDSSGFSKHLATETLDEAARSIAGKSMQYTFATASGINPRHREKIQSADFHGQCDDGTCAEPF